MLKTEDNELLTQVGPGTPMGKFMREYWVPALLSNELPRPDSDPVRVMLLGQRLIAFRDTDGRVGLVDHLCPHRGASLFFGRNEESGIRCVFHGWKFDVSGTCLETPNEPPESNFKNKIRLTAYPTVERGGIVWAYLGPRSTPPPLPSIPANMIDGAEPFVIQIEGNWLQSVEGDLDTTHSPFLHLGGFEPNDEAPGSFTEYQLRNRSAHLEVIDTEAGAAYGARRKADPGEEYWRITQWCFPFYQHTPTGVLGLKSGTAARVPMDDTHTLYYRMEDNTTGNPLPPCAPLLPNTTDWFGRFRTVQNLDNDFLIDRDAQRRKEGRNGYTGIDDASAQDSAAQMGGGPILDRTKEHLGSTDAMVIRVRRRLIAAVNEFIKDGVVPPGVDQPEAYQVRSGGVILPEGSDWVAATRDLRDATVLIEGLDPSINGPLF
jgi:phthalate 4,5-dioxygenase